MTCDEIEEAVRLYTEEGYTQTAIGKELGRDAGTIRRVLKKAGVEMRQYRDYYAENVEETYFQTIDTQEKAYWFGYLLADGCISRSAGDFRAFHFNIQRRDKCALEEFRREIGYTGQIRDHQRASRDGTKTHLKSGIDFNNKAFCSHLSALGWFEFKQQDSPDTVLASVPDVLKRHLVRGFFDGDGCITRSKKRFKSHYFCFAGSEKCLAALEGLIALNLGFILKGPKPGKTKSWRMGWNGNQQVRSFGEWIYKDATVYLKRKREKFDVLGRAELANSAHC